MFSIGLDASATDASKPAIVAAMGEVFKTPCAGIVRIRFDGVAFASHPQAGHPNGFAIEQYAVKHSPNDRLQHRHILNRENFVPALAKSLPESCAVGQTGIQILPLKTR